MVLGRVRCECGGRGALRVGVRGAQPAEALEGRATGLAQEQDLVEEGEDGVARLVYDTVLRLTPIGSAYLRRAVRISVAAVASRPDVGSSCMSTSAGHQGWPARARKQFASFS